MESRLHASKVMYLLLGSAALLVAALPIDEQAQASPSAIPDNARKRSYGWDCNRGFRETGGNCVAVIVPANALPNHKLGACGVPISLATRLS